MSQGTLTLDWMKGPEGPAPEGVPVTETAATAARTAWEAAGEKTRRAGEATVRQLELVERLGAELAQAEGALRELQAEWDLASEEEDAAYEAFRATGGKVDLSTYETRYAEYEEVWG